jgi:plasmid stabilization system protein ParE
MRLEFHPEALAEYHAAARYYARCQAGLGLRFVEYVEAALERIKEAPGRWAVLEQDVHRCLTKIFPYAILYTIEQEFVLILAVMHCHREPGYWRNRLDGTETADPDAPSAHE